MMRCLLLTPTLLMLLPPSLPAQESHAPPTPLGSYEDLVHDASVRSAGRFLADLTSKAPEIAEDALKIDDVFVQPGGKLALTIRNDAWKVITAWSIGIAEGSSAGRSLELVHTVDNYAGGPYDGDYAPLQPGQSRMVEYDLPHRRGSTEDDGPYRVLDVTVKAIVFDDGEIAGSDLRSMREAIRKRHVKAVALAEMEKRLATALRTGALESLLDEAMQFAEEANSVTSIPRGLPGIAWTAKHALNGQWLSALRMSAPLSGAGRELGEVLNDLKADPVALRAAAEATMPFLHDEQELLRAHLPGELRELLP